MPAVVLEAFLCRVPVVGYEVGGVSEILRSGETGWLVRKNDVTGFVEAACEAIDDIGKSHRFSENAYQMVCDQFTIGKVANRFLTVYKHVLSSIGV
jgi:glycosyltransferase involved in cell wall biosynthesis